MFIIDPSADKNMKFEAASESSTEFEVRFEASNSNKLDIEFKDDQASIFATLGPFQNHRVFLMGYGRLEMAVMRDIFEIKTTGSKRTMRTWRSGLAASWVKIRL
ncbi:hypothetical protein DC366_13900 [Pelagivirga sediminicola]|uniref:Uncharacterized protein n=1 Tax=Pelagivirga sediminicola TaxID=2170575 RepID=A0A2T7G4Y5_9RHOB|nr:hypothetical protein [Pelagivirga sediminicola]PVA09475.1 hypothetical protein DC366_13900 [Pelagivirga sediminicola]